jgi:DNA-directed RNA polymerase specialized sigma24 family protein
MANEKAKRFLGQIERLDCKITNKLAEIEQWKSIALGTTARLTERVQTSGSKDKMADAVNRYVEIEKEINKYIDELVDKRMEVIGVIEQLKTRHYDILHKRYIQKLDYYQIAEIYDKSYTNTTSLHGRALVELEKLIERLGIKV